MFSLLYILKIVFKTTIVSNFEHISSTSKVNGLFISNSNILYVGNVPTYKSNQTKQSIGHRVHKCNVQPQPLADLVYF